MLLIPQLNFKGDLNLDAFTFSSEEINAVIAVLNKARIKIVNERLIRDHKGSYGLRFLILSFELPKLEKILKIKFEGDEKNTRLIFNEAGYINSNGIGVSYTCSGTDNPSFACETFYADDDQEAAVKCALIAGFNHWAGGITSPSQS
jgi:hypothetical protein